MFLNYIPIGCCFLPVVSRFVWPTHLLHHPECNTSVKNAGHLEVGEDTEVAGRNRISRFKQPISKNVASRIKPTE